jgi:hypothetical protein
MRLNARRGDFFDNQLRMDKLKGIQRSPVCYETTMRHALCTLSCRF